MILGQFFLRLKSSFDVIGISEHKIRENSSPSNNIDIQGYQEFDYLPTETYFGGTSFYVKSGLDYKVRKDLNLNSPGYFEAMHIKIILPDRKILLLAVYILSLIHISEPTRPY